MRNGMRMLVGLVMLLVLVGCSDGAGTTEAVGAAPAEGQQAQSVGAATAEGRQTQSVAQADVAPAPTAEGVTVTGIGRVLGEPDTMRATVGVEVTADTVEDAMSQANTAAQDVIDAVVAAGVAEEDVQTSQLRVDPRYEEPEPGSPAEITGFVVTNLVEVTMRDLDAAGEVIQQAVDAGGDAARLQGVSFALEENDALLESARESAFADARTKAEQYARLAGRELGELMSVSEGAASLPPATRAMAGEESLDAAATIAPGQEETSVQLTATWALDG
ncbi:SIMPL domain-containing protein [soil metagenome]